MINATRKLWAVLTGKPATVVTVRELLGSVRTHGGAVSVERFARYPCDICHRHRDIQFTVLVPIVRGQSRPRHSSEAHRTFTICWRCLVRRAFRVRLMRIRGRS